MPEMGHQRTLPVTPFHVCLAPESGHPDVVDRLAVIQALTMEL
jgi:hypothetical protein